MKNKVATTVKIENGLYDQFKVLGIRHKVTLQNVVERIIYKYVNDESFRNDINGFVPPITNSTDTVPIFVMSSSLS